jgi:hypothetical protein
VTFDFGERGSSSCSPRFRLVLVVVSIGSGINLLGLPVAGCVLERLLLAAVPKGWGVNRRFVFVVVSTGSGVNFRLVFIVVSTGSGANLRTGFGFSPCKQSLEDVVVVSKGSALKRLGRVDEDMVSRRSGFRKLFSVVLSCSHGNVPAEQRLSI